MPTLKPENLQGELCLSGQALRQTVPLSSLFALCVGWGFRQRRTNLAAPQERQDKLLVWLAWPLKVGKPSPAYSVLALDPVQALLLSDLFWNTSCLPSGSWGNEHIFNRFPIFVYICFFLFPFSTRMVFKKINAHLIFLVRDWDRGPLLAPPLTLHRTSVQALRALNTISSSPSLNQA